MRVSTEERDAKSDLLRDRRNGRGKLDLWRLLRWAFRYHPPMRVRRAAGDDLGVAWLSMYETATYWDPEGGVSLANWVLKYAPSRARRMLCDRDADWHCLAEDPMEGAEELVDIAEEEREPLDPFEVELVDRALSKLSRRQAAILQRRLMGEETLESIGASYGFTRERARQIEAKVLARVRTLVGIGS